MRWRDGDKEWEGPWEEPYIVRNGTNGKCGYVWAVPTQEGFALQINALISVLTLGLILNREAIVMPFIANGPHYRKDVALGKIKSWFPMSEIIDIEKTLRRTKGYEHVQFVEFDQAKLPQDAKCISCAGKPPPHIHCPRGWHYNWCQVNRVRKTQKAKCSMQFSERDCSACVFSVGFGAGIQRTEQRWYHLKQNLQFKFQLDYLPSTPYCALQMRRGDKSSYYDKAGLTVDKVLSVASKKCAHLTTKFIATDDRSQATKEKASRAGFQMLDFSNFTTSLQAYLADLLLCVHADIYVGTAAKRMTSKQAALVQALRKGRKRSSPESQRRRRDSFLITE
uniref:O-fucosyltransferase family protein n=1 Tax=Aureoumbra lagunensis TaxID=44058 RepID=A0A7S3JYG6_9STRA|mmetsp:Transcript_20416/g.31161  ORF Transcript_20416/g.31161 Transcript_20416/m.31161 type:complete len:337 (+) Transcript_20416:52-1062(+)